ncbi:MAG: hypothetical protein ROO73_00080 [Roseivirga sp.]
MPAISTAIFAGAGKEKDGQVFTKAKFIATIYAGMREGIEQFVTGNSGHTMSIVLNFWDPE